MAGYEETADGELLETFLQGGIEPKRFDHRAHVRVTYLLLHAHGFEGALERLRSGLRGIFAKTGLVETPERGYHETVTQAWVRLVDATIRYHGAESDSRAFCNENPQLGHRRLTRMYYTKDRLLTQQAKDEFVEPDIAPLPK
jgi:hypothetical protein